jgi:hypothetical protein
MPLRYHVNLLVALMRRTGHSGIYGRKAMLRTRAYQDADPADYYYVVAPLTLEVFATFDITFR